MSHPEYPSPKRQRMSSPTYDEHHCLSTDEINAFDNFERQRTQTVVTSPKLSQVPQPHLGKRKRGSTESDSEDNVNYDGNDTERFMAEAPLSSQTGGDPVASQVLGSDPRVSASFTSPSVLHRMRVNATEVSSSEDNPAAETTHTGFMSAASLSAKDLPDASQNESDLPYNAQHATAATPVKRSGFGFTSALTMEADTHFDAALSSSPEAPSEPDYSSWFQSTAVPEEAVVGFRTARDIRDSDILTPCEGVEASMSNALPEFTSGRDILPASQSSHDEHEREQSSAMPPPSSILGFTSGRELYRRASQEAGEGAPSQPAPIGFTSGLSVHNPANKGKARPSWTAPSAAALAFAQQRMKLWQQEIDRDLTKEHEQEPEQEIATGAPASPAVATPARPALRPMENSPAQPPESPSPAGTGFARASAGRTGLLVKNKPFKPPTMVRLLAKATPHTPQCAQSPLNSTKVVEMPVTPKLPAAFTIPSDAAPATPLHTVTPTTPYKVSATSVQPSKAATPAKALGLTPRRLGSGLSTGKPKFATPFKPGMKPGEPGRLQLEQSQAAQKEAAKAVTVVVGSPATGVIAKRGEKRRRTYKLFDLNEPIERTTLADTGMVPHSWSIEELAQHGVDAGELDKITPALAVYYSFHATLEESSSTCSEPIKLGPDAALARLREMGCKLATKPWVDNHWGLILWKLAGMVCLDPEREENPEDRRWCFENVMKQLLYRYEREVNGGARPPLRLITTQDAHSACPMVLCVSDIVWSPAGVSEDGTLTEPYPELEVTDGWYRLRAQVDPPLERAIRKGKICVGRKIAVAGAQLVSDRKEPLEILDAYGSVSLKLFGNSSNLAAWHAKLGFEQYPTVTTLDKLTRDGGNVNLMQLEVIKVYPIAFFEFFKRPSGEIDREGPHNEKEEAKLHRDWEIRRALEEGRLRDEFDKKIAHYAGYSTHLRLYASGARPPFIAGSDEYPDDPPAYVVDLFDQMEEHEDPFEFIQTEVHPANAKSLAKYVDAEAVKKHERMRDEIERELEDICPPRISRSFRVILARDARWRKREPLRQVQVTVWDVLSLTFEEGGKPGNFKPGQQFLVSNLTPGQPGAWMGVEPDGMVYLTARGRNARWTLVK